MTSASRSAACLVGAWLALGVPAAGQAPTDRDEERPVVVIGTTLVQVDAIVTDRDGRPVNDLTRDDFEVLQDGKPHDLTAFAFVSTPTVARPTPVGPTPPARVPSEPVRRTIALVVDDLKSNESARVTRDALRRFVDNRMEPGDLVAIVQARAGAGALQQFSADRQVLHAAIDRVRYVPRTRPPDDCDEVAGDGERDLAEALRTDVFVRGTLGVLNFVVRGLKSLPGRKSVVLLSDGMPCTLEDRDRHETGTDRVRAAVLGLVDLANRSSVSVYGVDVRGVEPLGAQALDAPQRVTLAQLADWDARQRSRLYHSQDVLAFLSEQTGGLFLRNHNDIAELLRRAVDDQRGYYLLAYEADKSTFDPKAGGKDFHRLEVRVRRPSVVVRSRSGFYGYTEEQARPETRSPAQQMVDAVISPFAATDVRMQLTPLFADDAKTGPVLRCLLHVDARDLTFVDDRDGTKRALLDVAIVAFGDNGGMVSRQADTHEIRIRKESFDVALEHGLTQIVAFPMKRPGAYQLRAAVRDAASGRIGSDYRFVELPDVAGGAFAVSSVLVASDERPVDPRVLDRRAPVAGDAPVSPAVRRFHAGDRLTYGYEIYNAGRDQTTKRPALVASIRLYREGKLVHESEPGPLDPGPQTDWQRIRVGRGLQLGAALEPGSYVLEVTVSDTTGKRRTATQWVDFEVATTDRRDVNESPPTSLDPH